MGFFSSRRAEPTPLPANHKPFPPSGHDPKSAVHIIRSKFYGKGKSREAPVLQRYASSIASIVDASPKQPELDDGRDGHLGYVSPSAANYTNRSSTDAITMTLAQRLNELAVANADGLLDDNEYRVLRQSLFERFAASAAVPSESPIVKSVGPSVSRRISSVRNEDRNSFLARSPSLRSQTSISSIMSNLFRRATGRLVDRKFQDDQSIVSCASQVSKSSSPFTSDLLQRRALGRQPSDASLRTTNSNTTPHDLRSISSRWSERSVVTFSDLNGSSSRGPRSLRGSKPPPSAFNTKVPFSMTNHTADEDRYRTVADIRAEIQTTEAEEQRLLDSFSGLEISILRRLRQSQLTCCVPVLGRDALELPLSTLNEGMEPQGSETPDEQDVSRFLSTSISVGRTMGGHGHSRAPRLAPNELEAGMNDIRRRKAEIIEKYGERLDYLKARLRGAEIRERLIRK